MKSMSAPRDEIKSELLKSAEKLFSGQADSLLSQTLARHFPRLSFGLIVNWIPEQNEDIYSILLDEKNVAVIEIPHGVGTNETILTTISVAEYRKQKLSVEPKRKLEAALTLMKERMSR